ncbi:hypothetical protein TNCV_4197791 [Trichonephila clavipes]|nr:hypothetical protein TNCV_4197791 [Trichonephila clavipes]
MDYDLQISILPKLALFAFHKQHSLHFRQRTTEPKRAATPQQGALYLSTHLSRSLLLIAINETPRYPYYPAPLY